MMNYRFKATPIKTPATDSSFGNNEATNTNLACCWNLYYGFEDNVTVSLGNIYEVTASRH